MELVHEIICRTLFERFLNVFERILNVFSEFSLKILFQPSESITPGSNYSNSNLNKNPD